MTLLVVSPSGRIGLWLDTLCADTLPGRTTCQDLTEAMAVVAQGEKRFDWVLIEACEQMNDTAATARLRLAGCQAPIVQLYFSDAEAATTPHVPTLLCVVENRSSGPRVLGCRLGIMPCQAADAETNTIFEYRGPSNVQAASG